VGKSHGKGNPEVADAMASKGFIVFESFLVLDFVR
jgi:hypothetical protein